MNFFRYRWGSSEQGAPDRAFTLTELMIVVAIVGILAAVAIPAFVRYIRRSKTTEVFVNTDIIAQGAKTYFYMDHVNATGVPIARQFPDGVDSGLETDCCLQPGAKCAPNLSLYTDPTWQALHFSLSGSHYYRYGFGPTGGTETAAFFTVGADGNLDCDGVEANWDRTGFVTSDYQVMVGTAYPQGGPQNELE